MIKYDSYYSPFLTRNQWFCPKSPGCLCIMDLSAIFKSPAGIKKKNAGRIKSVKAVNGIMKSF